MQVGGNCGSFITASLLQTGKHTITAITRVDSQSKLPEGVSSKKVDYSKPETLVEALRGQDALVITLSGHVSKEAERLLINAAGEAGVGWILPNEWSPDTTNEALVKDVFIFQPKGEQSDLYTLYKPLADHRLLYLQGPLARPSQIWARVPTLLYLPDSGTSGVWPFLRPLGSTLPTAPSLFLTRVRPRFPPQRGHR